MKRLQEFLYSLHPFLLSSIAGTLTVAQIALAFFLRRPGPEALDGVGLSRPAEGRPVLHREVRRCVQAIHRKGTQGEFRGRHRSACYGVE